MEMPAGLGYLDRVRVLDHMEIPAPADRPPIRDAFGQTVAKHMIGLAADAEECFFIPEGEGIHLIPPPHRTVAVGDAGALHLADHPEDLLVLLRVARFGQQPEHHMLKPVTLLYCQILPGLTLTLAGVPAFQPAHGHILCRVPGRLVFLQPALFNIMHKQKLFHNLPNSQLQTPHS